MLTTNPTKILLLGMSCSGKSTIAHDLADALKIKLLEADDEVLNLNDGVWPDDEEIIDTCFGITNKKVLKMENILYVISWLERDDILSFYDAGFTLVEVHAPLGVLKKRKRVRDNVPAVDTARLQKNFKHYVEILQDSAIRNLFSASIDTSKLKPTAVLQSILATVQAKT
jgi:gluconate kinase